MAATFAATFAVKLSMHPTNAPRGDMAAARAPTRKRHDPATSLDISITGAFTSRAMAIISSASAYALVRTTTLYLYDAKSSMPHKSSTAHSRWTNLSLSPLEPNTSTLPTPMAANAAMHASFAPESAPHTNTYISRSLPRESYPKSLACVSNASYSSSAFASSAAASPLGKASYSDFSDVGARCASARSGRYNANASTCVHWSASLNRFALAAPPIAARHLLTATAATSAHIVAVPGASTSRTLFPGKHLLISEPVMPSNGRVSGCARKNSQCNAA
mmetsp:Transcript_6740/g.24582  ORF Transcript_6740/g.24582 Transcript_6740/m.24582 type:complete len:276 (-) Transcript_6740:731-1558(-)